MTAKSLRSQFEVVEVPSIYGGNRTGYLLRQKGNPIAEARLIVPFGTGNKEADAAAWKGFQGHLKAYKKDGTLPPPELIAQ